MKWKTIYYCFLLFWYKSLSTSGTMWHVLFNNYGINNNIIDNHNGNNDHHNFHSIRSTHMEKDVPSDIWHDLAHYSTLPGDMLARVLCPGSHRPSGAPPRVRPSWPLLRAAVRATPRATPGWLGSWGLQVGVQAGGQVVWAAGHLLGGWAAGTSIKRRRTLPI